MKNVTRYISKIFYNFTGLGNVFMRGLQDFKVVRFTRL